MNYFFKMLFRMVTDWYHEPLSLGPTLWLDHFLCNGILPWRGARGHSGGRRGGELHRGATRRLCLTERQLTC